ncbi:MAG: FAD binding domain-containing protein [Spirochaetaceae bacterium]|nr:FAD binding domain-containing protein [Spirochaetaceae bacterium]
MARNKSTVYYSNNLQDVLFHLKTVQELQVFGGCTSTRKLPSSSIILSTIPEFQNINMHEHFVEFGSAVTISQILDLGIKRLPNAFFEAAETIGTPFIKNIATIGGNICSPGIKKTLYAPLLALDAQLEIHSVTETKLLPISKFSEVPEGSILTKIKVPINEWDISIYKRVGPSYEISDDCASFVFLANTYKGILSEVRMAFCGSVSLRSKEWENKIIGTRLPISEKVIETMIEEAEKDFVAQTDFLNIICNPILKDQYLNLVRYSLMQLT